MKKLMLLGGLRYLIPVIESVHKMGYYVITVDYLPNNIAHRYSDEYHNVSIIDREAVLELAKKLKIDGIMSFACDPGVLTAAYVAEKMGLPFQGPYESVRILQNKGLFRKFLEEHSFNVPHAKSYKDPEAPFADVDYFDWPVIVKPVDSAGSKGVTKVDSLGELRDGIRSAMSESHAKEFIIEDFLTFEGYHSSADPFTIEGKLQFVTYSDQLFDKEADNPYTPSMIIWPTSMKQEHQDYLTKETQRLMELLHMRTGIYNIESCVGSNGKPYLMEVSPRGGGCKIAEIQHLASGVNLIENEIRKAVGDKVSGITMPEFSGHWCEMVIHARPGQEGKFKWLEMDGGIVQKHVRVLDLSVKKGDIIKPFTGANMSLGDMFLCFESRKELDEIMSRSTEWLRIKLEEEPKVVPELPTGWLKGEDITRVLQSKWQENLD